MVRCFSQLVITHHGTEVWKSDGTAAGTVLVPISRLVHKGRIRTALKTSMVSLISRHRISASIARCGKVMVPAAGTVQISAATQSISVGWGNNMANEGNTLYFMAGILVVMNCGKPPYHGGHAKNQDAANTLKLGFNPQLTTVNGRVYFSGKTDAHGYELWKNRWYIRRHHTRGRCQSRYEQFVSQLARQYSRQTVLLCARRNSRR